MCDRRRVPRLITIRGRRWTVIGEARSRRRVILTATLPIDGGLTDVVQIQQFEAARPPTPPLLLEADPRSASVPPARRDPGSRRRVKTS